MSAKLLIVLLVFVGCPLIFWVGLRFFFQPSLDRDWSLDQVILPTVTFQGDHITIQNVRNFDYKSDTQFTPAYFDRTYDVNQLERVWFMVELISKWSGPAHTLLSFEFSDGTYLAISAEIRKEKGETYSVLKGLLRQYELVYVIADERDVLRLRTNFRKHRVYLYPVRTTKEQLKGLFVNMLKDANRLHTQPEFYNTITNACASNIARHVNNLVPEKVPWSYKVLLPGHADELAMGLGLLDTRLPLEEARNHFRIDQLAQANPDRESFSQVIRQNSKLSK